MLVMAMGFVRVKSVYAFVRKDILVHFVMNVSL